MIKKSLIFVLVLMLSLTPLLVSYTWVPIVWFIEGAVIILLGLVAKKISIQKSGWKVLVLGLLSFFIMDWMKDLLYVDKDFAYQYFMVNAVSILIIAANLIANKKSAAPGISITWKYTILFKRLTFISIWFYMLRVSGDIYSIEAHRGFYYEFYRIILMLVIHMAFLFFILRSPFSYDKILRIFSYCCGFFGAIICLWLDIFQPILPHFKELYREMHGAMGILIFANLITILGMREMYVSMKKNRKS